MFHFIVAEAPVIELVVQRTRLHVRGFSSLPAVPLIAFLFLLLGAYWFRSAPSGELALWIVLFSALISSIAGFAFSPIAGAALFCCKSDPIVVVQILLVASLAQQLYCVWLLRGQIKSFEFVPYLVGSLTTLPLGVFLLLNSRASILLPILGIFLLSYGSFVAVKPAIAMCSTNALLGRILAGALGGITGGLAAFPAAFVAIWCQVQGFDKGRQRSIVQPFILINQVVAVTVLSIAHPAASPSMETIQYAAPAILGAHFGVQLFGKLSTSGFNRLVGAALAIAGILMVAKML
jgi:uncharacterized membrane protein YfcA